MFDLQTIDIDVEKKKITIWNNQKLYQLIKSDAVAVLSSLIPLQHFLESIRATIECGDPGLGQIIDVLSLVIEAAWCYEIRQWTLNCGMRAFSSTSSKASARATPITASATTD